MGSSGNLDPYTWLKFVDWAADGKILDYDEIYKLNWMYLCQILSMKIMKKDEEIAASRKQI